MKDSNTTRQPAVAGLFYPGEHLALENSINDYLSQAGNTGLKPVAIIAPHAGYQYSGTVAAHAYAELSNNKAHIKRVALLGPCHRVPLRGLATSSAKYFSTPLGSIELDTQANQQLLLLDQVTEYDATHAQEHSLEVHLPFLQTVLEDFLLVPLVVGDATPDEIVDVLEMLNDEKTVFVISSDLSHFHDYDTAKQIDRTTCNAIEHLDTGISYEQACGRNPVLGLLRFAKKHKLKVKTLDLKNSGDTAGDRQRVVGYGAWAFTA